MSDVHRPQSEAEACEMIRHAAGVRMPLSLVGSNTRAGLGNRVEADMVVTSAGLAGVIDYDPGEMVMTAKAGTPLSDIAALLDANAQMLAFEPVDHRGIMNTQGEPTIGGVFLSNASGPRRLSAGAARDSLLGLRFVNGRGEAIRAGGRVMKNVTGLDLVKLLAGSHGTLGFVTEVTFRVLPRPETEATILLRHLDDAEASQAMAAAMAQAADVSGAAHIPKALANGISDSLGTANAVTALRLEGLSASVEVRVTSLAARLSAFAPVEVLDASTSTRLWHAVRDVAPLQARQDRPLWRVSVAPTAGHRLVAALRQHVEIDALYDWQGGLVWLEMSGEPLADVVRRAIASVGGGHATLIRASDHQRSGMSAFEPEPEPVAALSARIKGKLDPAGIFSPGRMAPVVRPKAGSMGMTG
ncbi:2-hydroxy-acid oxidase [Rhizobium sp. Leaf384]|uniref:glycolate oxidase subunit GlcE n=1 Tax=unclassified Rhizobium TaxID=2613769 RepID=UPI00071308C1|nr:MULTISPECIES: glycolate oxidase subunit GlcE [unclassified Rhizobium]KQS75353.1 2-hydroxy-acid oxidase [Rhizobium sp. Leaf383]KQS78731.1 2-hydroxy-acid oxidase [Rhizobium sp. Leaf384]